MKNILSIILLSFLFIACEDAIHVDLNTAPPQLVIDAPIIWDKTTDGKEQTFILSKTGEYYADKINGVNDAVITVTNSKNEEFIFTNQLNGNFKPEVNETYTLKVTYNSTDYLATEKLISAPDIKYIESTEKKGFGEDPIIEVKTFFQDNPNENNFYLIGALTEKYVFQEFGVFDDKFTQGNVMNGVYISDEIKFGQKMKFQLSGISAAYYEYAKKLLSISGNSGGGPFQTPSSKLIGNIINQKNNKNNPLGFFRASQITNVDYIITPKS
jgi:hypothetical protein